MSIFTVNNKITIMKKIITSIILIASINLSLSQIVFQSTFQNWAGGTPTDWFGTGSTISNPSVLQWFTGSSYGTFLCGLSESTAAGKGLATQNIVAVGGTKYKVEINVESNMGEMAIGYYDVTNSTYGPISAYRSVVASGAGILVVDSITVPLTCTSMQLVVYARNTAAFGIGNIGVCLDRVIVTVLSSPTIPTLPAPYKLKSIYDIQYSTAVGGGSPYEDSLVETSGIVTAAFNNGYFIQDSAKGWNGVYVFDNVNTPAVGDEITLRAEVDEFFDLTELKNVDTVITISSANTLPLPVSITTTQLNFEEQYEGVLCKMSNLTCVNPSIGNGEWLIHEIGGAGDTSIVDDLIYAYTPVLNSIYNITGIGHYSFGDFKIEPRDSNDVVRLSSVSVDKNNTIDFTIYPNPASDILYVSGENLERAEIYSSTGKLVNSISLNSSSNIDVSELTDGVYIIKVISGSKSSVSRFMKQ